MLEHEDIRPGTVIADHKVGLIGSQRVDSLNIPLDPMDFPENKAIALNPCPCDEDQ
jgi:hypothetical protein